MTETTPLSMDDLQLVGAKKMLLEFPEDQVIDHKWASEKSKEINDLLDQNGALLLRGLSLSGSKKLSRFLKELFQAEPLEYNYRSTPRTKLRGNVYTSSEYHPAETIVQHNEASYSNNWPMRIGFYCAISPETGGQTPISDSHEILKSIPEDVVAKFEEHGVMYVRNYSDIDLPWTEVFGTKNPADVETYCNNNDIQFEWLENGTLRTRQINQATLTHPVSNKKVWFNQAHLFHVSALPEEHRNDLLNMYGEENLPRNVYFGNGDPIDSEVLDNIRDIYEQQQIKFDWAPGDLMLLDNVLFTHGRTPYTGDRKILVGMARPYKS